MLISNKLTIHHSNSYPINLIFIYILLICVIMKEHIFNFCLIIDGDTEIVSQLIIPLKTIDNKSLHFNEQKCIFKH
jgi:hypothetical protein